MYRAWGPLGHEARYTFGYQSGPDKYHEARYILCDISLDLIRLFRALVGGTDIVYDMFAEKKTMIRMMMTMIMMTMMMMVMFLK